MSSIEMQLIKPMIVMPKWLKYCFLNMVVLISISIFIMLKLPYGPAYWTLDVFSGIKDQLSISIKSNKDSYCPNTTAKETGDGSRNEAFYGQSHQNKNMI